MCTLVFLSGGEQVFLYKNYIDDKLKVSISGRNKNKALVEGVKALEPHRVCVSATTNIGKLFTNTVQTSKPVQAIEENLSPPQSSKRIMVV